MSNPITNLRSLAELTAANDPELSLSDKKPRAAKPSLSAFFLGLLLWLVVRPILRQMTDLTLCRRRMERLDWKAPFRNGHSNTLAGVPVHIVKGKDARRVVLYLHGGGFFMRPTSRHVSFLEQLCAETESNGFLPAYRLAPEHPFPCGLNDCINVYQELLAKGVPAKAIVIAGESAGGNLVLSLLMRMRKAKLPLPACAVLISAATDLSGVGLYASYRENHSRDALVPPEALPRIVSAYVNGRDPAHPDISPLNGDFKGLPPLYFLASRHEVLREDTILAFHKARDAGVNAEIKIWRGLMHAFPLFIQLPEAQAARADIVRFITAHTPSRTRLKMNTFSDEVIS